LSRYLIIKEITVNIHEGDKNYTVLFNFLTNLPPDISRTRIILVICNFLKGLDMKLFSLFSVLMMAYSCAQIKKPNKKFYSPEIFFRQKDQIYKAAVRLPKSMKEQVPLVVIVHEWWGRNDYIASRSDKLNQEGFATLAVDLYGDGKTTQTPDEAQSLATPFYQDPLKGVKLLNKYISLALKDPHVDPNKIFVIGYCFGGTQALNLARSGAKVAGVVSFHGGLDSSLKSKGINAKILALNGLADPMVPATQRDGFEDEMKKIGANYKMINYKNATHAFTNPKSTEVGKKFKMPIAYNKAADESSWMELLRFIKQ
jgi:dienelactone hydrolase